MDQHIVAAVSITSTCLDVLGSLYLAYDLLGGQHGPLRLLTRAVRYSIVFGTDGVGAPETKTAEVVSESRRKHGLRAPSHSTLFRDSGRIHCRVAEDGYGQPATFTDCTL